MTYPVHSVTRPADLTGTSNGQLPPALLTVLDAPGRVTARAHDQCARSWFALRAELAARFNETVTVTSSADAYRTYAVQESTFRLRYTTTPLPGRPSKVWNGQTWYQRPGTAMAATPGTSNHGWGLALDICLWRNEAIVGITANGPMFAWLLGNAHRYGFSWEAQSEPWHLRLFTGDATPAAVLAFEAPPAPTPTPPITPGTPESEEDEMPWYLTRYSDGGFWLIRWDRLRRFGSALNHYAPVPDAHAMHLVSGGVPLIEMAPGDIERVPIF